MRIKTLALAATLLAAFAAPASATEIIYTPINPSFGGNPLNGNFLLNKAQIQNDHKATTSSRLASDPITDFESNLSRRLLSALASQIVSSIFGDGTTELPSGPITIGDLEITINPDGPNGTVVVTITDLVSGEVTTIELPANP